MSFVDRAGSTEWGRRTPTNKESEMSNPVVHFEVVGQDGPRLQRYYADLFGWKLDVNEQFGYGTIAPPADGSPGIGGGIGAAPGGGSGHVTFYVGVPDVEAALAKAQELGGARVFGPAPVPGTDLELGQFTDPEGRVIGLMKLER
jgi:predicted enzyme related to lactoylglutathione lyase